MTDPNREIELKLSVRPEDVAALRAVPALGWRGKGGRAPAAKTLESTYFDTAEHDLSARGVTLRVRKQGDRCIQTVKAAPDSASGLARPEWEWPVAGPGPDLAVVVEPEALALLGELAADALAPVFTSVVKRTVRMVERDGATIEVAFDAGEIRLPDGVTAPLSEVELELKDGPEAALFAMALDLARAAPVRVETRSKAARGFALAQGRVDGPVKAEKLALDPATTVEEALARILRACLVHATANEACVLRGEDAEGVHQMRVALRRLRSALSLFRPFLPADRYDWLVREVKWLAGSLGPARDWDVFIAELLGPVRDALGGSPLAGDLDALLAAAVARRATAYEGATEAVRSQRYTLFLLEFGAWLEARGWRAQPVSERSVRLFQPVTELADEMLAKRHRKARKTGRGFERLAADDRHQHRIALKKLRYAAEFFRTLYDDKASRRYQQEMSAFQDALGHLNDVATATRLLRDLHDGAEAPPAEARAAGIVIGWHARGVADNEDVLVALWEDFFDAKPFWSKPPREGAPIVP